MATPITIEGKKYFVSLPSLPDFRTFRDYLQSRHRREAFAALPSEITDAQLKQFMRVIDEQCKAIDPFANFSSLVESPDGAALLFHSLLRHENQGVTLDFVTGLMERAESGRAESLEAIRELREAMAALLAAKKNEREQATTAAETEAVAESHSTSTCSA